MKTYIRLSLLPIDLENLVASVTLELIPFEPVFVIVHCLDLRDTELLKFMVVWAKELVEVVAFPFKDFTPLL
jgi:hypothetical protein